MLKQPRSATACPIQARHAQFNTFSSPLGPASGYDMHEIKRDVAPTFRQRRHRRTHLTKTATKPPETKASTRTATAGSSHDTALFSSACPACNKLKTHVLLQARFQLYLRRLRRRVLDWHKLCGVVCLSQRQLGRQYARTASVKSPELGALEEHPSRYIHNEPTPAQQPSLTRGSKSSRKTHRIQHSHRRHEPLHEHHADVDVATGEALELGKIHQKP